MKKKTLIAFIMLGLFGYTVQSQSLSPTVISSSGGFYTSTAASLSFTVAEMTMVQTFSSVNNILTQGFQQAEDLATDIPAVPVASEDVLIYPNPTSGAFMLNYYNDNYSETIIKLFNLLGQVVLTKPVSGVSGLNTVHFDISSFNQGIYMLELTTSGKKEKNASYYKINLVY